MGGKNFEIMEWVRNHGELVDADLWQARSEDNDEPGPFGQPGPPRGELYDLKGAAERPEKVVEQRNRAAAGSQRK
jgi:hypothetical protein